MYSSLRPVISPAEKRKGGREKGESALFAFIHPPPPSHQKDVTKVDERKERKKGEKKKEKIFRSLYKLLLADQ